MIGHRCNRSDAFSRVVLIARSSLIEYRDTDSPFGYHYAGLRVRHRDAEHGRTPRGRAPRQFPVVVAQGSYLFPFRTEKSSLVAPMVLGGQLPGRVGRRRILFTGPSRIARGGPVLLPARRARAWDLRQRAWDVRQRTRGPAPPVLPKSPASPATNRKAAAIDG